MAQYSCKLRISGFNIEEDHYEDALYEAGCDDALVAVIDGTIFLDFDREASSYENAVKSAIRDVEHAGGRVLKIVSAAK